MREHIRVNVDPPREECSCGAPWPCAGDARYDAIEYRAAMDELLHFGALYVAMLEQLQLEKMASTVENADAVGPFVDPTTYRAALADRRLDKQRAAISAARTFVSSWHDAGLPKLGE